MDTRRDFIIKAMLLTGVAGWDGLVPESISKAAAIDPAPGSTFLDAEHVVILMQENRSFDHCFGTLKGVRGFNDPRAIQLPSGNPVWLQSDDAGATYAPFRFDIKDTKITWMGCVPHSRSSQVDANNDGKYDRWLETKRSGNKSYAAMPLTMGYYTREDIPFNYALADAFTVCDQNFSSAMTSTWPNRLFLWSGRIRGEQSGDAKAYIRNEIPWGEAQWTTFPELLEKNNVSWRVYQNDLTAGGGFKGEERAWLSNFGCNLLETLSQFNVRFSPRYVQGLKNQLESLPGEIETLKERLAKLIAGKTAPEAKQEKISKLEKQIADKEKVLREAQEGLAQWNPDKFGELSAEAKSLHEKAFTTNVREPDCRELASLAYEENGEKREMKVPKGDVLHQFREDVNNGKLPTVSWLVGPEKFTDHPSAPWFGSWYVSEVLDILTKNPEVWKKTIFILTYDENDGYFDHVPPFVAPDPRKPETGKCSAEIDTSVEHIRRQQELDHGVPNKEAREGPVGLGFRVPMVIASPWTRGGRVCSQVFDHTSVFRFVQSFVNKKFGKAIHEDNTSLWRKTVSGDLTEAFRPYHGGKNDDLPFLKKEPFIRSIYDAKFKAPPTNFKSLSPAEAAEVAKNPLGSPHLPQQEPGVKPSCALPYQLYAEPRLSDDRKSIQITMEARNEVFGARALGAPFNVYIPRNYLVAPANGESASFEKVGSRSYAVAAGDRLTDSWPLASFEDGIYHLRVYGPNGFYRACRGDEKDPSLLVTCDYERDARDAARLTGRLQVTLRNVHPQKGYEVEIRDMSYKTGTITQQVPVANTPTLLVLDPGKSFGWYDFAITVKDAAHFERRFAGKVESGEDSFTDPLMGRVI